jgi:hypothetical protein
VNLRIYLLLLAVLLAPPALTQETAPPLAASSTSPHFDLRSDAIRKIIRDTASTQYANVQEPRPAVAESEPAEFHYVPP